MFQNSDGTGPSKDEPTDPFIKMAFMFKPDPIADSSNNSHYNIVSQNIEDSVMEWSPAMPATLVNPTNAGFDELFRTGDGSAF